MSDTIYAITSGQGKAGVAVVRVSGPGTCGLIRSMCGGDLEPRKAQLVAIKHPESLDILDRGLVLWFPAPHSFTGEDVAEFHVHGGVAVIAALLQAISGVSGLRLAEAGEFVRRAFYNGKLDLTRIEGIADLIDAETEVQRRQALHQMSGGLGDILDGLRIRLIHILAYVEAGIDFSDEEDVPEDVAGETLFNIKALRDEIISLLDDYRSGERLRQGLQVAIVGPPNVGKSSLLNVLAKRDVAIVSDQAGTTRDVIEVHLDLEGLPVTVSDTAGLREIDDLVEEEGVRRAKDRLKSADLILWTCDATEVGLTPCCEVGPTQSLIRLRNKADLYGESDPPASQAENGGFVVELDVSAKTGLGIDILIQNISKIASKVLAGGDTAVLTRVRHREALERSVESLTRILTVPEQHDELIAEGLRMAARELGRVTGRVDVEDLLDVIFRDFCVGK